MLKSTQSVSSKASIAGLKTNEDKQKPAKRVYGVRIFYAIFFGIAVLGFAFQSPKLDAVDLALISVCAIASLISFVLSIKSDKH
jgi:hypothetical protein